MSQLVVVTLPNSRGQVLVTTFVTGETRVDWREFRRDTWRPIDLPEVGGFFTVERPADTT